LKALISIFAPKSIAVIGASRREGSLGKMFLDAVVGMDYKGSIYPINPKAERINNIRCYTDISSVPDIPDLAIILLPKEMVLGAVQAVAQKKVRNIIIISAGFKEVGAEGRERENTLVAYIKNNNMRMIGPNSMGLFNTEPSISLNATFSPTPPIPGHVGFISQSGALGVAVLELSQNLGLGFSCFVSTGNKADINDADCLRFLAGDNNTNTIILYQESIENPAAFREICMKIVPHKPILTLKAGRTESGLKAASSHTGVLASDDIITDTFLKQCGIIRCETLQELLDTALALISQPMPSGNKVAIVTNAGGPGILASDALENHGLELALLSEDTILQLRQHLPPEAGLYNPVDMIASATHETYRNVCSIVDKDKNVDSIFLIIVKPPVNTTPKEIIEEIKQVVENSKKPFFCTLMAQENPEAGLEVFRALNLPVFSFPESSARALGNMIKYMKIKDRFKKSKPGLANISKTSNKMGDKKQATFREIMELLSKYGLNSCDYIITSQEEEIVKFQKQMGPIVLKIANEEIIHKSDAGLVKLNLSSSAEVKHAFNEISTKAGPLISFGKNPILLAQKMVRSNIELVLGAKRDPVFGATIMFGIGGIFVELYKDVVFRILPVDEIEIHQMLEELKGKKILEGFRHYPAIDFKVLTETILNFSTMIDENPEIVEMDLNPLLWSVDKNDLIVVDSRCTLTGDS
jgi:acetyltransferase